MTEARFTLTIPDLAHDTAVEMASTLEENIHLDPMAITINETDEARISVSYDLVVTSRGGPGDGHHEFLMPSLSVWRRVGRPEAAPAPAPQPAPTQTVINPNDPRSLLEAAREAAARGDQNRAAAYLEAAKNADKRLQEAAQANAGMRVSA